MIDVAASGHSISFGQRIQWWALIQNVPASNLGTVYLPALCVYDAGMRYKIRFLWNATKGHRLAPWRSPYLLWRIETYTGVKMTQIGFLEFWEFVWRERRELWGFLKWTGEMERWVHPKPKNP